QLIGHLRSVVLGRVDVVDPGLDRSAQDCDRLLMVLGRSRHARTGELHRSESDAPYGRAGDFKCRCHLASFMICRWLTSYARSRCPRTCRVYGAITGGTEGRKG